jgi:hypothetical protein
MNQSCSSPKFVARARAALLKTRSTINRITAALVLSACVVAAAAQSNSPAFAKFKSEMMPKVGQKITVVEPFTTGNKAFGSRSTIGVPVSMRSRNQASKKKTTSMLTFAAVRL